MLLILQIALGIVLAVVILRYWCPLLRLSGSLMVLLIGTAALLGAITWVGSVSVELLKSTLPLVSVLLAFVVVWLFLKLFFKAEESVSSTLRKRIGLGIGDIVSFTVFFAIAYLGFSLIRLAYKGNLPPTIDPVNHYVAGSIFLVLGIGLVFFHNHSIKKKNSDSEKFPRITK